MVTLRNPSAHPARFALEPGAAFELPAGRRGRFRVTSAYADTAAPVAQLEVGRPTEIRLQPFQVLVLEARPLTK
jgi:hypothetical protein